MAVFLQARFHGLHAAGLRLAGGNEHQPILDVIPVGQTVGDVLAHADGQAAAVFFDHFQLAVDYFQCRFDAQQIGPEGQHAGAAAAFGHEVQPVQHEAQLHPPGKALQLHLDGAGRQSVGGPLCCLQHQIALPGADVLAVHDADILEFAGGQPCILEAGRQLAADRNMDHSIVLFGKRGKEFRIFHQIGGGGFGHLAALVHISEHIRRVDGHTVQIAVLSHQDVHGHQGDVPLLQKLFGQVTGAVRGDLDLHVFSPFCSVPFKAVPFYCITNGSKLLSILRR